MSIVSTDRNQSERSPFLCRIKKPRMKFFAIIFVSIAVVFISTVFAALEVPKPKVVKDKFIQGEIVPDILDDIKNLKFLKVSYPSGVNVDLGNELTPTQVKDQPTVEWEADEKGFYTLVLTDLDVPSRVDPVGRELRHWWVANIEAKGQIGQTVFEYIGAGPPPNSGLHRYVFLLFKQKDGNINVNVPSVTNRSVVGRLLTSTRNFTCEYNLKLVAGNFFQAQYDDYVKILYQQLGF